MRIFLFMALSLAFIQSKAQNVRIVNGAERETSKNEGTFDDVLDLDSNFFYVRRLSTVGSGFTQVIQKVSRQSFNIGYTMEYKYDSSNRDLVDETEIQTSLVNDKVFVFTRKYNLKESVVYLLFRRFDATTGNELGEQQIALAFECPKKIAPQIKFYVEFSPDKSKMLIGSNISKEMDIYNTKTVSKFGKLSLDFNETSFYSDFTVDNSGNLLCLERNNKTLNLVKYELNKKNPVNYLLFDNISGLKNSHIEITKTNILVCGLTNDLEVFCTKLDLQDLKVLSKASVTVPPAIKKQLNYAFNGNTGAHSKYYAFENLIFGNDAIFLIQSQSYITYLQSGNGPQSSYKTQTELLVTRFSKNGDHQWTKLVPKQNSNHSAGFNAICKNDQLYLFYLQHPKDDITQSVDQYENSKIQWTYGLKGCALVCAKIDTDGNVARKIILLNKDWFYKSLSRNIVNDQEKSLTIQMVKGKKERYDKIFVD